MSTTLSPSTTATVYSPKPATTCPDNAYVLNRLHVLLRDLIPGAATDLTAEKQPRCYAAYGPARPPTPADRGLQR